MIRQVGRVLVIDAAGRLLLLEGASPGKPGSGRFWFTPGGGADPGESLVQAAARELLEETGIGIDPAELSQPVWHRFTDFVFDGVRYQQDEHYFVLRVGEAPVSLDGLQGYERRSITGYRWWTADELAAAVEPVHPPQLVGLLRGLA